MAVQAHSDNAAHAVATELLTTPIGVLEICVSENGVVSIAPPAYFSQDTHAGAATHPAAAMAAQAAHELAAYFAGTRTSFDVPIDWERLPHSTPFRLRVWKALCNVAFGEVWTYQELACAIGKPQGARAVGQALNKNPVLIVIPCHRIIAKHSNSGGFALGMNIKNYLLNHEKYPR